MGIKYEPVESYCYDTLTLLDEILGFKLDSQEFISNEKIISKIGTEIDRLNSIREGHTLFSVTKDKDRTLILLLKKDNSYYIYSWKLKEAIEKKIDVEVHENSTNGNLYDFIVNGSHYSNRGIVASSCIVETLNGYNSNLIAGKNFTNYCKENKVLTSLRGEVIEKFIPTVIDIGKKRSSHINKYVNEQKEVIQNFLKKYHDIPFTLSCEFGKVTSTDRFMAAEIATVKEIGGKRHHAIKWTNYRKFSENLVHGIVTNSSHPTTRYRDVNVQQFGKSYIFTCDLRYSNNSDNFDPSYFERIPYNLLDEGRLILGYRVSDYDWRVIISPDPKVDPDFKETFEKDVKNLLSVEVDYSFNLNNSFIEIKERGTNMYFHQYADSKPNTYEDEDADLEARNSKTINPMQEKLKTLKKMCDEYNYVVKKNKAIGEDITVTDKIKYNHEEGKISYNDFSIAINDDYIKAKLYEEFQNKLVDFYRNETSEQVILDSLIAKIFHALTQRLDTKQIETIDIPVKLNGSIDIKITGKPSVRRQKTEDETKEGRIISVGKIFYLNDQRFNKNELLVVLKEITCYRNQEEADAFITNIGRLGLSVYIGITTGYEVNTWKDKDNPQDRIFKFKKLQGRSNYQLLLDNTSIPIKGKKLIGLLYENFIGDNPPNFLTKIPQYIYDSCESTMEYLKYKVLIDSTYEKYKDNAKAFLNKKVDDLDGKHVKYFNKRSRKKLDAVFLTGISGRNYVVAYDSKDSFVFMDPEAAEDPDTYKEGKYICMVDQSNIKSNISFDTVVSKLMALKNDSSIAHTIYNLQEEL